VGEDREGCENRAGVGPARILRPGCMTTSGQDEAALVYQRP